MPRLFTPCLCHDDNLMVMVVAQWQPGEDKLTLVI